MKIGLIARAEDRGLGIQTWEFARAMQPDRTMVIDMGALGGDFEQHLGRYPGAMLVPFDGHWLPKEPVLEFLRGLDVVFSAETLYDWRLAEWARQCGVATVVQVNPEFYKHNGNADWAHPSAWWNPTTWRMDTLPAGTAHVPVPVALDRFVELRKLGTEPREVSREGLRVLHVGGRVAVGDRNGTALVAHAARMCRSRVHWTVQTQAGMPPRWRGQRFGTVRHLGPVPNYWDLYKDQDVLVLPRRYGGLCLPVQEACAAGLAVLMSDTSPNADWPVMLMAGRPSGQVQTPGGRIPLFNTDPGGMAKSVEKLIQSAGLLALLRDSSREWAEANSWDALRPLYLERLAEAAERP